MGPQGEAGGQCLGEWCLLGRVGWTLSPSRAAGVGGILRVPVGEAGLPTCRLGCKVEGTPGEVAEEKRGGDHEVGQNELELRVSRDPVWKKRFVELKVG